MPVFDVRTMDERLDTTLARPQFYSTAVAFFGGLGLLLAIIGVYGVTSYSVLQRTREMGIRLALGTTPGDCARAMLRQSALTIGLGALAGPGDGISDDICRASCTALVSSAGHGRARRRAARPHREPAPSGRRRAISPRLDIADVLRVDSAE